MAIGDLVTLQQCYVGERQTRMTASCLSFWQAVAFGLLVTCPSTLVDRIARPSIVPCTTRAWIFTSPGKFRLALVIRGGDLSGIDADAPFSDDLPEERRRYDRTGGGDEENTPVPKRRRFGSMDESIDARYRP